MDPVLSRLKDLLIAEIPSAIKAAAASKPLYCVRVYYDSTDMSDITTRMWLVWEATRTRLIKEKGRNAPYNVWSIDEVDMLNDGFGIDFYEHAEIADVCGQWYARLSDEVEYKGHQDDDFPALGALRESIQEVCVELNKLDWNTICPVTDDFVIFPADGSHTYWDDYGDLVASVSTEQLQLLREHGFLGPHDNWDQLDEE